MAFFVIKLICDPVSQRARMELFQGLALSTIALAVPKELAEFSQLLGSVDA